MAKGIGEIPRLIPANQTLLRESERNDDGSLLLVGLLLVLTVPAAHYVNIIVPTGYMDEEFHVNQVEHYCRGDFSYWDPKITTFPGLYLVSLVYLEILLPGADYFGYGHVLSDLCGKPAVLRSVNLVLFAMCALLFREIALHLDQNKSPMRATFKAFVLSLYPLHWFFTLLYYTEMGSAAAVMGMYLYSLRGSYWISALLGAVAILFRQPNVIWVLFVLCVTVLEFLETAAVTQTRKPDEDNDNKQSSASNQNSSSDLRQRRPGTRNLNPGPNGEWTVNRVSPKNHGGIFVELKVALRSVHVQRKALLWNFFPFVLVLVTFLGFVVYNGSVVVGDKDAHKVSPHFTQVLYCGLVLAAFQANAHFSPQRISDLLGVLKRNALPKLAVTVATIFAAIAVHYYGDPHPYLLADNRHFTFYIWKNLLQAHWSLKYLAIPVYIYSWSSILSFLAERQKPLWIAAFCVAVAGVLMPTPLLEFRYYNVPFYFIFLHMSTTAARQSSTRLFFTPFQFMSVNYLTVFIFLSWTFQWENKPGAIQRFMW